MRVVRQSALSPSPRGGEGRGEGQNSGLSEQRRGACTSRAPKVPMLRAPGDDLTGTLDAARGERGDLWGLLLISLVAATACAQAPVIAAYLPDYRIDRFALEQAADVTDLLVFSVRPDEEGHVRDPGQVLERLPRQRPWRLLLSVGGGGAHRSDAFPAMAADPARRARFIEELLALCRRHHLDGIDLDWEHLEPADPPRLATLLVELKQALSEQHLLLTVAVADPAVLRPEAVAAVDRVHLMAYDGPAHGSLGQATALVERALAQGIPPHKLLLGVPLYALTADGTPSYRDLLDAREDDEVGSLGPQTLRAKAQLVQQKHLGGVFFWELTQDARGDASLIKVAHDALERTEVTPWKRSGGR